MVDGKEEEEVGESVEPEVEQRLVAVGGQLGFAVLGSGSCFVLYGFLIILISLLCCHRAHHEKTLLLVAVAGRRARWGRILRC